MTERLRIAVEGVVQGVGFRPYVYGLAARHGVSGFVANRAGDVIIEAEADAAVLKAFVGELAARAPSAARIDRVTSSRVDVVGDAAFAIAPSESVAGAAAIAPDVATCAACIDEITAPGRRCGYPFTSCAACGPRLTIVTAAPYDRARTTMAGFAMCDACRREYEDTSDRRFHAQPIACPACGPRLTGASIEEAAAVIAAGGIVAVKGLGGYHLACDARSSPAVAALRARKRRDAKPFAVMVEDVAAARAIAHVDDAAAELLVSSARPIVLVPARPDAELTPEVAPGVADLGVMLAYTPIHHLLLRALGGVPLVMTSGNVSDEPLAFLDDDARDRLAGIADAFVGHDRAIRIRCDDSIARVVDGAAMVLRRARGLAPAPLRVERAVARPTLALGGHLKAAFALSAGDVVFVSPHAGDLDDARALDAFVDAIEHFAVLHRIAPVRVVCDRHPDYATTRLAAELGRDRGWEVVAVQHHHAHFASALADAGLSRAIGVVFDGAGHGDDAAIWGGEILVGDAGQVRRAMHVGYVAQPGGDAAARWPVRMAVAHLVAAGERWDDLDDADPRVAAMCGLSSRFAAPTSSVGRLFDAVAALAGWRGACAFEGQAAMWLERLARSAAAAPAYPFELRDGILDVAPVIRAVATDRRAGVPAAVIARRFHSAVVEMTAAACLRVAATEHVTDVVLSGGVFQNALIAAELPGRLAAVGLRAHHHRRVPPNDGGLSFGQLAVVAARDQGAY